MADIVSKKVVVLGAGPSGLCAAWNLVQDGYRVVILEKESVCGGQSITFQRGDYKYDIGPHNIHSKHNSIIRFLQDSLKEDFVKHNFFAEIFFQGKRIKYPLMGTDVLRNVNPLTAVLCGLSFLWTRTKTFFYPSTGNDESYKAWIINRFGRRFYNIFFGPYTEKVWKIPPEQISNIVAQKRIAVSGILELIHTIIFKKERYHPENIRLVDSYYPLSGIGSISEFFKRGILDHGGEIINNAEVNKLFLEKNRIAKVVFLKDGTEKHIDLSSNNSNVGGEIISTIPVNEMISMIEGNIPNAVIDSALSLDFTAEVFLYLNVKHTDVFGLPLFYFSGDEFPFNRIYDVGIFSRSMVPQGKNAICLEISCTKNDELWNMDDKDIFELCISPLESNKLLNRKDVEDYHTQRLSHAYPRFRIDYKTSIKTIFDYLDTNITNIMSFGRQGLFTYANVDDAIWMGFEVAKHMKYKKRIKLPMTELLSDYIST
ncbi:MAG: FAD-dependent oxidoreductase [Candidatus Latescibacteria bacterium]|nr:FAD-dependent oxidoreductase [Candidatus Latescibacterota bacterium]